VLSLIVLSAEPVSLIRDELHMPHDQISGSDPNGHESGHDKPVVWVFQQWPVDTNFHDELPDTTGETEERAFNASQGEEKLHDHVTDA
jgi:hypothetical protein